MSELHTSRVSFPCMPSGNTSGRVIMSSFVLKILRIGKRLNVLTGKDML